MTWLHPQGRVRYKIYEKGDFVVRRGTDMLFEVVDEVKLSVGGVMLVVIEVETGEQDVFPRGWFKTISALRALAGVAEGIEVVEEVKRGIP